MTYPVPEPGLVISFSYLWSDEAARGHVEGQKPRPCAIVVATTAEPAVPGATRVAVLPITHVPQDPAIAVELPAGVKRHLGLDDERSWVVLNELNTFVWPGFDLRELRGRPGVYDYGQLPPRFVDDLIKRWTEIYLAGRANNVER